MYALVTHGKLFSLVLKTIMKNAFPPKVVRLNLDPLALNFMIVSIITGFPFLVNLVNIESTEPPILIIFDSLIRAFFYKNQ